MDNLTHSAIGLAVGETITHLTKKPKLRIPILIASCVGNNLPDLDVLYAPFFAKPFGNLLHHRGHTHTLAWALPLGLLIFVGLARWWKRRGTSDLRFLAENRRLLVAVGVLGIVLHIFADSWNSYGVHPFWPVDNHWYSGDVLFILEPLIWIVLAPFLAVQAQGRVQRMFSYGILALGGGLMVFTGVLPWPLLATALLIGAAMLTAMRRVGERARHATVWTLLIGLLGVFWGTSVSVRRHLESQISAFTPTDAVDIAVSPFPADPTCWFAVVTHLKGDEYTARTAIVSAWPNARTVASCQAHMLDWGEGVAPKRPNDWPAIDGVFWGARFVGSQKEFASLRRSQCHVETFLQFSRAPYWFQRDGKWILGDLRFDRAKGMRWSRAVVGEIAECPKFRPPWVGPKLKWFGGEQWNRELGLSS